MNYNISKRNKIIILCCQFTILASGVILWVVGLSFKSIAALVSGSIFVFVGGLFPMIYLSGFLSEKIKSVDEDSILKMVLIAFIVVCIAIPIIGCTIGDTPPIDARRSSNTQSNSNGYYCEACKTDYSDVGTYLKERNKKYLSHTNLCESCYKDYAAIMISKGEWGVDDIYEP